VRLQAEQTPLEQDCGADDPPRFRGNMLMADRAAEAMDLTPRAHQK
jgi:hypothetical protein